MIAQAEGRFAGSPGQLYWRAWNPTGRAKALLVLVHGYAEHIGRYEHVANFFRGRGFAFYAFDQAGHGKSDGRRGYINAFTDYLTDLKGFIALAQAREPGLPTFLLGHSMGGLESLTYGEQQPAELRGIIVSSPGLRLAMPVPAWKLVLGKALSRLAPSLAIANGIPSQFLTHDPAISGAYAQRDPLVFKTATARFADEFFRAETRTLAEAPRFIMPCLLMHGGDDRIASPEGTRQFLATAGSADKSLKIYDGFYHEIFNEIGKERVFEDVAQWLEKHP
jgi:acylglycerol lipase